jgi:DNA polymerase IV
MLEASVIIGIVTGRLGILHADVDAFFASVEARDQPALRDRPFAVAAEVVMCASYAARELGVRAGVAVRRAVRGCPGLVLVPPRFDAYATASSEFFTLLGRYGAMVEPGSMEEGFLSIDTDEPAALAADLRRAARTELGLPVSVGVGRTKLMAKLGSRRAKPDGVVLIDGAAEEVLRPALRFVDVWGVGPTSVERLRAAGLVRVGDLAGLSEAALTGIVGTAMARRLLAIATGTDDATVRPPAPRRGVSAQRTISPPTRNRSILRSVLSSTVATALGRMEVLGRPARRIEVIARYDDGSTVVSRAGLPSTHSASLIESTAFALLDDTGFESDGRGVTLVGLSLTLSRSPTSAAEQLALPL